MGALSTSLFVTSDMGTGLVLNTSCRLTAMCIGIFVLVFPVAAVAETFEYDVLRALNNPLVCNRAQRHFGQQLLAHLRTLDWGFRFGGTVINAKLVMNIGMALIISIVTTVSQAT